MVILLLLVSCQILPTEASIITLPFVYVPGQILPASQLNANFQTIYNDYNGNITNANLSASAGIVLSKLQLNPGARAFNQQTTGSMTWASGLTTDTQPSVTLTSDGWIEFGPGGTTAPDVYLKRSAATTLQLNPSASTLDMQNGTIINVSSISGSVAASVCGGRVYLSTGQPYTDTTATSTIFFGPAQTQNSGIININGTVQTFSEVSLSISGLSTGMYDIYAASASSSTVSLSSTAWTGNNTPPTRGTDSYGRLTKNGSAANLLVASIFVNNGGSGQTINDTASRWVSNVYNAVPETLFAQDSSNETPTGSIAPVGGNTTDGVGRVSFVSYRTTAAMKADYSQTVSLTGASTMSFGIALNSTSAYGANNIASGGTLTFPGSCSYSANSLAGFNFVQKLCQTTLGSISLVGSPSNALTSMVNN